METVLRCQTRRALFFFTVDIQERRREKKRVPRWIDKYMIHRDFGLNFKYRRCIRKEKHRDRCFSPIPGLSSAIETTLYNEYRLYKRLTIVSKCSSSPLTFSSTCARWIGSLRTRSRHLWLQFFPPLLFQIQDFTTRVRLQDYSIVFGDLHKNLTQRTIQQSFFFLQLINYSLFWKWIQKFVSIAWK